MFLVCELKALVDAIIIRFLIGVVFTADFRMQVWFAEAGNLFRTEAGNLFRTRGSWIPVRRRLIIQKNHCGSIYFEYAEDLGLSSDEFL